MSQARATGFNLSFFKIISCKMSHQVVADVHDEMLEEEDEMIQVRLHVRK